MSFVLFADVSHITTSIVSVSEGKTYRTHRDICRVFKDSLQESHRFPRLSSVSSKKVLDILIGRKVNCQGFADSNSFVGSTIHEYSNDFEVVSSCCEMKCRLARAVPEIDVNAREPQCSCCRFFERSCVLMTRSKRTIGYAVEKGSSVWILEVRIEPECYQSWSISSAHVRQILKRCHSVIGNCIWIETRPDKLFSETEYTGILGKPNEHVQDGFVVASSHIGTNSSSKHFQYDHFVLRQEYFVAPVADFIDKRRHHKENGVHWVARSAYLSGIRTLFQKSKNRRRKTAE
jgi:hypothetical protein